MRPIIVDLFLGLVVMFACLGVAGFARLGAALDRLHAVAFITVGAGGSLVLAAFVADGPSTRAFKILLLWLVALVVGAAVNHAVARAIFTRDEIGKRT